MPPKSKFTKEEIIKAAFEIVREQGASALTARFLGEKLQSSSRPIFTVFHNMQEVQLEVQNEAKKLYTSYLEEGLKEPKPFKGVGQAYIRFAIAEPKLFQLLFMREFNQIPSRNTVLNMLDTNYEKIITSIENEYHFTRETALNLYFHLFIYTHGIAVLIVTKVCAFSPKDISDLLTEVNLSLVEKIKKGEIK